MCKNVFKILSIFFIWMFITGCASVSVEDDYDFEENKLNIQNPDKYEQGEKFYFDTLKDYVGDDIVVEFASLDKKINNKYSFKVTINNYLKNEITINYDESFIALLDDSGYEILDNSKMPIFSPKNISDDVRIIEPDMALELSPYPLDSGESKVFYICIEIKDVPYYWKTTCSLK